MIISGTPVGPTFKATAPNAVWSPNTRKKVSLRLNCDLPTKSEETTEAREQPSTKESKDDDTSPVWQPFGAPYDGPQFRPVKLEVTTTSTTTKKTTTAAAQSEQPPKDENETTEDKAKKPSEKSEKEGGVVQSPVPGKESPSGKKTPETPLSSVSTTFVKSGWSSHLPPSQSPTITLLQKAREGQIPKGAIYLDDKPDSTPLPQNAVLIDQKVTVEGDKVHTDSYYAVPTLTTESTTVNIKAPPKYDGIGPTEYGIPVGLRTGVKEEYASDWYKTMYKSLHRGRYPNEPSHAVHFGGYMSEPEFDRKDTYRTKYSTVDHRRKPEKSVSYSVESPAPSVEQTKKSGSVSPVVRHEQRKYQVEPRSIAEYEPGRSSLAEKEFQKHEHLGDISSKPQPQGLNRRWANVLLSDGYESDSTLIRKTGRVPYVDPEQQKAWYKEIQKGGEIPLIGLRKSAPEKPAEVRPYKPHPATHVYGVEPPCFNHKHVPNTSCNLTPAHIFRATPLSKNASCLKQNGSMATKRSAPVPPVRFSSKRIPVLQPIVSNKMRTVIDSESRKNTINSSLFELRNHRDTNSRDYSHKFHSCEDLYGFQDRNCSNFSKLCYTPDHTSTSVIQTATTNNNSNHECIHSRSKNTCDINLNCDYHSNSLENKQYPLSYNFSPDCNRTKCINHITHPTQSFPPFSCICLQHPSFLSEYSKSLHEDLKCETKSSWSNDIFNENSPPNSGSVEDSIVSRYHNPLVSVQKCVTNSSNENGYLPSDKESRTSSEKHYKWLFNDQKGFTNSSYDNSIHINGNGLTNILDKTKRGKEDTEEAQSLKISGADKPSVQDALMSWVPKTGEKTLAYSDSFFNLHSNLSEFPKNFYSFEFPNSCDILKRNNCHGNTSMNIVLGEADTHRDNFMNTPKQNNIVKKECSRNTSTNIHNTTGVKTPYVANYNITPINENKVLAISSKENIPSKNCSNVEVSKYVPDKDLSRMITILPSVIHVSNVSVAYLEPKLARSEPQMSKRLFCRTDINPLRLYLKLNGQSLSQNFDDNISKNSAYKVPDSNSHKLNILTNKNLDKSVHEMIFNKHNYICKELESTTNKFHFNGNTAALNNNHGTEICIPSVKKSTGVPLKALSTAQNGVYKSLNMSHLYAKNRRNIFMNKNNAILYHQYISTMVRSVSKSRKFRYLVNFYSNLEAVNNSSFKYSCNKFQVIKIREFDISWGKVSSYRKWEKDEDKSLKVKHSSVEDLRQLFQSIDNNIKENRNVRKMSFHYTKLWYNVSVSNLVQKYNSIHSSQEIIDGRFNSRIDGNKSSDMIPLEHATNNSSGYSVPVNFLRIPGDLYAQKQVNFSEFVSPQCSNAVGSIFPHNVNSSHHDLRGRSCLSHDVRSKVQYFEDISQTKRFKKCTSMYHYASASIKVSKFSHSRNLSWSDLREIERTQTSADNENVFSPRYLPEKAVSCLDLTFESECSHSSVEPSLSNSEHGWASSTTSCISQESTDRYNDMHIRTIKTGTVSKIRNKLEKFVMSRSQSVPQNLTSLSSNNHKRQEKRATVRFSLSSAGSVQNLKKLFEHEEKPSRSVNYPNSRTSGLNSCEKLRRNESVLNEIKVETKSVPDESCLYTKNRNVNRSVIDCSDKNCESLMKYCMTNRIKSLMSKFEQINVFDVPKNIAGDYGQSLCRLNVSSFCPYSLNETSVSKSKSMTTVKFSIENSITSYTFAGSDTKTCSYHIGHDSGWPMNSYKQGKVSDYSKNLWKQHYPKVMNSFPKPYVREVKSVCNPLKTCRPGL